MKYKLPPLPEAINDNRQYGRAGFHASNAPAYTAEQMQAYAIAAIEAQGMPDGWQLVPKEPTPEMLRAALTYHSSDRYQAEALSDDLSDTECYVAMLASAPPAPQAESNLSAMVRIADQIKKYGPVEPRQARRASADFDLPAPNDNIDVEQASEVQQVAWLYTSPAGHKQAFTGEPKERFRAECVPLYTHPAQQAKSPEWYALWIRNNYQDHPNIQSLCDALIAAANAP